MCKYVSGQQMELMLDWLQIISLYDQETLVLGVIVCLFMLKVIVKQYMFWVCHTTKNVLLTTQPKK